MTRIREEEESIHSRSFIKWRQNASNTIWKQKCCLLTAKTRSKMTHYTCRVHTAHSLIGAARMKTSCWDSWRYDEISGSANLNRNPKYVLCKFYFINSCQYVEVYTELCCVSEHAELLQRRTKYSRSDLLYLVEPCQTNSLVLKRFIQSVQSIT